MFIAVLFTIAKMWKQPKYPLMDEWIRKVWYIHIMEYYPDLKSKKILTYAMTWMNLEVVMLNDMSVI